MMTEGDTRVSIQTGDGKTIIETTGSGLKRLAEAAKHAQPAGFASDQLRAFIERIERLEEEKATIAQDVKEVYAEAKANGFDTKTMRKIVSLRRIDKDERQEQEALIDLYMRALGMAPFEDTPLGKGEAA